MTLYYFKADSSNNIACSATCAQNWPPLTSTTANPASATSLSGTLSVFAGPNGQQVEYNGHPLYRYRGDTAAGDTKGEGLFQKWFVATPTLTQASSSAAPAY
jgi:predicted lipoprotein with Yx(FWY)xxD motif